VDVEEVAREIVDSALKVHRALGPGLLESAYQACLAYELRKRGHQVDCEMPMPLEYNATRIDVGYRLDMRVNGTVIVENKTVEEILPIHHAQLLTYLKLSGISLGFLINWNVPLLRDGLKRVVLNHPYSPMASKTRKVEEDTTLSPLSPE
jgi:GxxExxY protein